MTLCDKHKNLAGYRNLLKTVSMKTDNYKPYTFTELAG